ncbi:MAG TPA: alternative ribosome rescue aminoacyl-tRNA hydrolase ArfB [Bacteroidia bacterium]|nr:alternative ribosome rescue aminoacyl-tRNA hydrolase ArfB [Bacteroidia bacterium]HNU32272.1 alternative ribosome rescue aminoacyl-tRNA hydrolase ArfB [Bacteroidia bacterium]
MENFNAELLLKEVEFRFTRSGGKGGQNVNKVASKAELYFNINQSLILLPDQKETLLEKLAARLSTHGVLKITSQEARSQLENKEKVSRKFIFLITKAFYPVKARKETKPGKQAKEKRLKEKKMKSLLKKLRQGNVEF